jgi:hypothetical protein
MLSLPEVELVLPSKTTFLICRLLIFLNEKSLLMLAMLDLGCTKKPNNCATAAFAKRARLKPIPKLAKVFL